MAPQMATCEYKECCWYGLVVGARWHDRCLVVKLPCSNQWKDSSQAPVFAAGTWHHWLVYRSAGHGCRGAASRSRGAGGPGSAGSPPPGGLTPAAGRTLRPRGRETPAPAHETRAAAASLVHLPAARWTRVGDVGSNWGFPHCCPEPESWSHGVGNCAHWTVFGCGPTIDCSSPSSGIVSVGSAWRCLSSAS